MTIDERVDDLMANLPYLHKTEGGVAGFQKQIRTALLETARDQRHECANAVEAMEVGDAQERMFKNQARPVILKAELK